MADVDILERLSSFIDYESPKLTEFLYGLWGDQANAITYHELRDAIMDGSLSLEYLRDWQQDYSKFIVEAYKPVAEKAIAQAAADLRTEYGAGFHDPMAAKVDSFIQEHGGQLIRRVSVEQYNAVNTLVRQAAFTNTMTVDQLARVIRPCVGLTTRQAQTTKHFYQSLVDDGYSHKEAYKRQLVYAAKVHRRRAALIAQTELAYAYSAGWHATIEQNVEDGVLPPGTKKVWLTAEDEKVCPECGKMNGEAVLWNEPFSNGSDYPPAHPNCRCHHKIEFVDLLTQTQIHEPPVEPAQTQITTDGEDYAEEEFTEAHAQVVEAPAETTGQQYTIRAAEEPTDGTGSIIELAPGTGTSAAVEVPGRGLLSGAGDGMIAIESEQLRRYVAADGHEIIDQPTYNKLTKPFLKNGGTIIRGEEAARHLEGRASAAYIVGGNTAFIRDDPTVSDVIEEMYHAKQDRRGDYADKPLVEMLLRREVDAQNHLLRSVKRYKIPAEETAVTRQNLKDYKAQLAALINKRRWHRGIFKLFDRR